MKKHLVTLMPVLLASISLISCTGGSGESSTQDFGSLTKVEDETFRKKLFSFTLNHNREVPGQYIDISVLWTGFATQYPRSPEDTSEKPSYYTFLAEPGKASDSYYFIYINASKIEEYQDWFAQYATSAKNEHYSCEFNSSFDYIDGKYLLASSKNEDKDLLAYQGTSLEDAPITAEGYELALVLQTKPLTIKENVSTGESIGEDLTLLHRLSAKKGEDGKTLIAAESSNYSSVDDFYSISNEMLVAFGDGLAIPSCLQDESYAYTEYALINQNKVSLPRYSGTNDMLDESFTGLEDIYLDYKSKFLDAYLEEDPSHSGYGFYDLTKVKSIIKDIATESRA